MHIKIRGEFDEESFPTFRVGLFLFLVCFLITCIGSCASLNVVEMGTSSMEIILWQS